MPDGSTNLLVWDCKVPGKAGTAWEGADFALTLGALLPACSPRRGPRWACPCKPLTAAQNAEFSSDFPMKPPKA